MSNPQIQQKYYNIEVSPLTRLKTFTVICQGNNLNEVLVMLYKYKGHFFGKAGYCVGILAALKSRYHLHAYMHTK